MSDDECYEIEEQSFLNLNDEKNYEEAFDNFLEKFLRKLEYRMRNPKWNTGLKFADYLKANYEKNKEPIGKVPITIRIDEDIVAWFKSKGDGYQTKMNAALRAVMQVEEDPLAGLFM